MDNKPFVSSVARRCDLEVSDCADMIRCFGKILESECTSGNDVSIPGFGKFSAIKDDEQIVVEPATKKRVLYPPVLRLVFTPDEAMLKKLSTGANGD